MEDILQILETAIQLEHKGHEFYREAADDAKDPIIQSILNALAHDEDEHESIISRFYQAMEHSQNWSPQNEGLSVVPASDRIKEILGDIGMEIGPESTFIGTYEAAYRLEVRARDFYREQLNISKDVHAKAFFNFLMHLEDAHIQMLDMLLESTRRGSAKG